ncbi:MAG: family 10 glycosylhydrolase [Planctomycetota bacterium]|nr:family 10 glycosylhydrolase [Planctomycetota bacterium]
MRTVFAPPASSRAVGSTRWANRHSGLRRLLAAVMGMALVGLVGGVACAQDLQLRVAWGGGDAVTWHGTIAVEPGKIVLSRALGVEADEPGSMWTDAGQLIIRQRSSRQYDGVDLDIETPPDSTSESRLIVALEPAGEPTLRRVFEIKLSELIDSERLETLDDHDNRLIIRRAPGDRLRVRVQNPSLVLAPSEPLQLQLQPHLIAKYPGGKESLQIVTKLTRARGGEELNNDRRQAEITTDGQAYKEMGLRVEAPVDEGVYDFVITATVPAMRRLTSNPFGTRERVVARRVVQFVVIDPDKPTGDRKTSPDKVVDEINPDKPWWKRVTQFSTLPGLKEGPLENGDVRMWQHPTLGKMIQIGPGATEPNANWTAYPLSIQQTGQPHILEVEYPSDLAQSMSISVLEPNAAGAVLPVGLDSGVFVSDEAADFAPSLLRHRLVFWPRTKDPVVLITNRRDDIPAVHGRIRVLGPPKSFRVGSINLGGTSVSRLPRAVAGDTATGNRMFAAYMERPLVPENFSATEAFDPTTALSMDDWVTFYEAGTRLTEYLNYAGYNALFLSVLAGGSTIYPSQLLEPTPRYDTGTFLAAGHDPVRKDVLEMLFRLCDREGIRLVPVLQFSSALPELEVLRRRNGPEAIGLELLNANGKRWPQVHSQVSGPAAHYNPLNARVQKAIVAVVGELVDRYRGHHAFGGLAIGCSGNGYALLPGPDWGLDAQTVSQFERDTGIGLSEKAGGGPSPAVRIQREYRNRWLDWRADRLRDFHGRLAAGLRVSLPNGKLYVATTKVLQSPDIEEMLRPSLPARFRPDDALLAAGIRPAAYRQVETNEVPIVLLNPQHVSQHDALHLQAFPLQLTGKSGLPDSLGRSGEAGSFFSLRPDEVRLTSFDQKSPFGQKSTRTLLVPHLAPSGEMNRRRFVRSLAAADTKNFVNGGWMLPLGQEGGLRDLIAAYRRLPDATFETIEGSHQPLTIRRYNNNRETYIYLVNDSPWPCRATLDLSNRAADSEDANPEELSGTRKAPRLIQDSWLIELNRFDFFAMRCDAPDVQVANVVAQIDDRVPDTLRARIKQLSDRVAVLNQPSEIGVLENPDFELAQPNGTVSGWQLNGPDGIEAEQDLRERITGRASVRLTSNGNVASLVSHPIKMPRTGRLAFTVSLKTDPKFKGPVRLAVSGQHAGRDYYRFGVVSGSPQWRPFRFPTVDLPLDGLENLQIRFDLMGAGAVWIDDVHVSVLDFNENERREFSKILFNAHLALEDGRVSDCQQLLHGYWPRFLLTHVPDRGLPAVIESPRDRQAELPPPHGEDRPKKNVPAWKRLLPGSWQ